MPHIREKIQKLKDVDGFVAAGVFDSRGELIEELSLAGELNLAEIGDMTSETLKKSRKLADSVGIGELRFLQMTSNGANILARRLNDSVDASARAIAHIALVLGPRGATALGKLKLNSVAKEIADEQRRI